MSTNTDKERLDWMIAHSAAVYHDRCGNRCRVFWRDSDGVERPSPDFTDAREAVDHAMEKSK